MGFYIPSWSAPCGPDDEGALDGPLLCSQMPVLYPCVGGRQIMAEV